MNKTNSEILARDNPELFVLVEYQRGSMNTLVPSKSGDLHKLGAKNYGMHKKGDKFYILKTDQKLNPDLFKLVKVETVATVLEETTAEEPKKIRRKSSKKES